MKKAYIVLSDGFETIEALTPLDVLVRSGVKTTTLSIGTTTEVRSSQGVRVVADALLSESDLSDGDLLILPGGYPGYVNLASSSLVAENVAVYHSRGALIGAICGAPTVLATHHIAEGATITAHSSVTEELEAYKVTEEDVVRCGNIITGKGAGLSLPFALALAEALVGSEKVAEVRSKMEL